MQIVFFNTFERVSEEGVVLSARLSISELEGIWTVIWTNETNGTENDSFVWFEGSSWEEMIMAFRHGIAVKMGEGYAPIIDGMLDERRQAGASGSLYTMLQCYSDLFGNDELYAALRDWRRSRAIADRKSAYLVATNRTLKIISAFVPQQKDELLQLPGWGEAKQAAYAEEVLAITGTFQRTTSFPLSWVAGTLDPNVYAQWVYKQKEDKYKLQMDRQQEKRRLLGAISEGKSLDELQHELDISRRDILERIEQLESEGYDIEPLIDRELSQMPQEEQHLVLEAMDEVGDRYLKPVLFKAYGEEAAQGQSVDLLYERLRLLRIQYRRLKPQAI